MNIFTFRCFAALGAAVALICIVSLPDGADAVPRRIGIQGSHSGRTLLGKKELMSKTGCTDPSVRDTSKCLEVLKSGADSSLPPRAPSPVPVPPGTTPIPPGGPPGSRPSPFIPKLPPPVFVTTPNPVPTPPPASPLAPGVTGQSIGSISGFILVVVASDGKKCYTKVDGHLVAENQTWKAGTYVETYGTLGGVGECQAGSTGVGIALLHGDAFINVIKRGGDCLVDARTNTHVNTNTVGHGTTIIIEGGFGASGGCH